MIRAALVYAAGWLAIVIASGDAAPLALRYVASLPVGRLVPVDPNAAPRPGKAGAVLDKQRVVSEADRVSLVARVIALLQFHGVSRAVLEQPSGRASVAGPLVADLAAALVAVGVETERADAAAWRATLGGRYASAASARDVAATEFRGWPAEIEGEEGTIATPASCALAGALLVSRLLSVAKVSPAAAPSAGTTTPPGGTTVPRAETPAPSSSAADRTLPLPHVEPAPVPHVVSFVGPCVAGIDPGSRAIGLAIVDSTGRLVHRETLTIGHEVHLDKPATSATGAVRTHKRVIDAADVAALLLAVILILRRFDVRRVVLEWIKDARVTTTSAGLASSVATHLVRAQWIGGAVHGLCLASDPAIEVRTVIARTWFARVTGAKTMKGRRGVVAPIVEARWPELVGGDEHQRDAAGLLAWDAMPPPAPPAPPKPRARAVVVLAGGAPVEPAAPKLPRASRHKARADRATKARAAAGCACTSRRHVRTCPMFKPTTYGKHHDD